MSAESAYPKGSRLKKSAYPKGSRAAYPKGTQMTPICLPKGYADAPDSLPTLRVGAIKKDLTKGGATPSVSKPEAALRDVRPCPDEGGRR